jgi:hypothetical protein
MLSFALGDPPPDFTQGAGDKTVVADPFALAAAGPFRRIASHYPDSANFHCQTRGLASFGGRDSIPKDTKPKGFPT